MRKGRLLRLLDVVKTDPACALHVPHALLRPLTKVQQAKVRVQRREAGALHLRGDLHAPVETRAHRAVRALKNRAFVRAGMPSADRKRVRVPVRLAESPRSILCKRAVMPHGSGCRRALLQHNKIACLFQKALSASRRALLVLRRSCARPGVLRYQKMNPKKKLLRHRRMRVLAEELRSLRAVCVRKASVVRRQIRRTTCLEVNRGFRIMC